MARSLAGGRSWRRCSNCTGVGLVPVSQAFNQAVILARRPGSEGSNDRIVRVILAILPLTRCAQEHFGRENNPNFGTGKGVGLRYNDPVKVSVPRETRTLKNPSTTYDGKTTPFEVLDRTCEGGSKRPAIDGGQIS